MPKTFAPLTAQIRWRFHQIVFLVLLAGLLLVAFIALRRNDFILILSCGMILAYGSYIFIRTFSIFLGMSKRFTLRIAPERLRDLDEKSLPIYTILLPVYREPAILDQLLRAMEDLDYPKEKLDVKLLLEADDQDTRQKVHERPRPVWLDIVDVPQGTPKTKPRACNVGLTRAKGEFVVIFDAEDRPERDQLKKAVLAFRSLPEKTICLQAKLNCYNPEQNFLTRMFTLEYTAWFDLYLPGLHAIGAPIPLGGTSNHFRIGPLKAIGAWDPYNVTEDCDLGMRIARRGYDTQILDSTTWEEAASQWSAWYKQRTRWLKGYFQTVMVHTQYPRTAIREFGLYRFVLFLVVVGGQVGTLSLSPVTWILSAVWLCLRWPIMDAVRPWTYVLFLLAVTLGLSNFLFIAIHAIGAYFRKQKTLGLWSILFPFYWLLMSAATWRGFMQFFTDPFKWEKTPHGLATHESTERSRDQEKTSSPLLQRLALLALIALVLAVSLPVAFVIEDYSPKYCFDNFTYPGGQTTCLIQVNTSWGQEGAMDLKLRLPDPKPYGKESWVVDLALTLGNGAVFHRALTLQPAAKGDLNITLPFDSAWTSADSDVPMDRWALRRVRTLAVSLDSVLRATRRFDVRSIVLKKKISAETGALRLLNAAETAPQDTLFEIQFQVDRTYTNPFDPEVIDLWLHVRLPDGHEIKVPAFYDQDFRAGKMSKGIDRLIVRSPAFWAARFTPRSTGTFHWRIDGKDHFGNEFHMPERALRVTATKHKIPKSFRIGPQNLYESEGQFFYPIPVNLAWPIEERNGGAWDFALPRPDQGLAALQQDIRAMPAAGINMIRMWSSPWFGGLEWNQDWPDFEGLGKYSLPNAWRLDQLFTTAEENGRLIEMVLEPHGTFSTIWDSMWDANPYNKANGGMLRRATRVFTDERAKSLFKQRFRYMVARYGTRPSLFAWTLFNEVNSITTEDKALAAWTQEMSDYLKSLSPESPFVSTSFSYEYAKKHHKGPVAFETWKMPGMNFLLVEGYDYGLGLVNTFLTRVRALQPYAKPIMIAEYGGAAYGGSMPFIAHEIHDGLWLGWMLPLSGSPAAWWWSFLFEHHLTHYYQAFHQFMAGEDLSREPWSFIALKNPELKELEAVARVGQRSAYLWVYSPRHSNSRYLRSRSKNEKQPNFATALSTLHDTAIGSFNPLAIGHEGALFQTIRGAWFSFSGLEPGHYKIEFWDTWGQGKLLTKVVDNREAALRIEIPPINRDIALKIQKIR